MLLIGVIGVPTTTVRERILLCSKTDGTTQWRSQDF
jgi:hypothetical protein